MRKIFILIILSVILLSGITNACLPSPTAYFRLDVFGLKVDMPQMRSLCRAENCVIDNEKKTIVIQSIYDHEVGLEIGEDSASLQLPFKKNIFGKIQDDFIIAQAFAWKKCLQADLQFLREQKVVEINNQDIEMISSLAQPGGKIVFEKGVWKGYGASAVRVRGGIEETYEIQETDGMVETRGSHMVVAKGGGCGEELKPLILPREILFNP
jgi:hypothetical protein